MLLISWGWRAGFTLGGGAQGISPLSPTWREGGWGKGGGRGWRDLDPQVICFCIIINFTLPQSIHSEQTHIWMKHLLEWL